MWLTTVAVAVVEGSKYNQRVFEDVAAIDYADPTKNGFRVIMSQSFISRHLKPGSLPTIFVTAIPLHSGEERFTNVLYPEAVRASPSRLVSLEEGRDDVAAEAG